MDIKKFEGQKLKEFVKELPREYADMYRVRIDEEIIPLTDIINNDAYLDKKILLIMDYSLVDFIIFLKGDNTIKNKNLAKQRIIKKIEDKYSVRNNKINDNKGIKIDYKTGVTTIEDIDSYRDFLEEQIKNKMDSYYFEYLKSSKLENILDNTDKNILLVKYYIDKTTNQGVLRIIKRSNENVNIQYVKIKGKKYFVNYYLKDDILKTTNESFESINVETYTITKYSIIRNHNDNGILEICQFPNKIFIQVHNEFYKTLFEVNMKTQMNDLKIKVNDKNIQFIHDTITKCISELYYNSQKFRDELSGKYKQLLVSIIKKESISEEAIDLYTDIAHIEIEKLFD